LRLKEGSHCLVRNVDGLWAILALNLFLVTEHNDAAPSYVQANALLHTYHRHAGTGSFWAPLLKRTA
jgi:hypothetical protein